MKETEFRLHSRGGEDNRLIRVGDESSKRYKLKANLYRVGFNDNPGEHKKIFIDPSGGPFMEIGSEIEGHKIKAIHDEGIIEFE